MSCSACGTMHNSTTSQFTSHGGNLRLCPRCEREFDSVCIQVIAEGVRSDIEHHALSILRSRYFISSNWVREMSGVDVMLNNSRSTLYANVNISTTGQMSMGPYSCNIFDNLNICSKCNKLIKLKQSTMCEPCLKRNKKIPDMARFLRFRVGNCLRRDYGLTEFDLTYKWHYDSAQIGIILNLDNLSAAHILKEIYLLEEREDERNNLPNETASSLISSIDSQRPTEERFLSILE